MPSLRLTDQEARDLVAFIMTMKDDRPKEDFSGDITSDEKIAKGAKLIREYGMFRLPRN